MAKDVYVVSWCDAPGCREEHEKTSNTGQDTQPVQVWVYVTGKGRKTKSITVDMCAEHVTETRAWFSMLQKVATKEQVDE